MYTIRAFVNGNEDTRFKDVRLPLNVAKIICGLSFANIVTDIRKEGLDDVIVIESDYSCYAKCVGTGVEFEYRIEEAGA